jgi:cell division protein FtsL
MMVLVYGLLCAMAVVFAKWRSRQEAHAKTSLETADARFNELEANCKAEEVRTGRPASLALQMNLMKAFEVREAASSVWKNKALRQTRSQRRKNWLVDLAGRKLSYAFGLFDTVAAINAVEFFSGNRIDLSTISGLISQLF